MKTKKIILFSILAVIVIIIIASIAGSGEPSTTSTTPTTSNSVAQEWTEVTTLNGSGDKKSQSFSLNGNDARVRYKYKADTEDAAVFAFYVVEKGVDIMKEGGIPEVMITKSEDSESSISHLSEGDYYLIVSSANGNWEIVVEELK